VRKGRSALVPIPRLGFPRKSTLRSIATCARSIGAHIPCTTLVIVIGLKRTERKNQVSLPAKKGGHKGNPVNHNIMQLTKKIKKLEKALKKSDKKVRNAITRIAILTPL
jgi:hypothetical protein